MTSTSEQHDDDLLELLAGRDVPNADKDTRHDAALMRDEILSRIENQQEQVDREIPEISDEELEHRWRQMRFEIRRKGLFGKKRSNAARNNIIALALAATLVGVFIVPNVFLPPEVDNIPEIPKGMVLPVFKTVDNPQSKAEAFAAELQTQGFKPTISQVDGGWAVRVDLDASDTGLVELLQRFDVEMPEDGRLHVWFVKAGSE